MLRTKAKFLFVVGFGFPCGHCALLVCFWRDVNTSFFGVLLVLVHISKTKKKPETYKGIHTLSNNIDFDVHVCIYMCSSFCQYSRFSLLFLNFLMWKTQNCPKMVDVYLVVLVVIS